ncbi:MAG: isoleucyl-tRNA synthetase [Candidatus Tokpelaia sp. JSC161]|nr:MAG: isoleucyl-tRNA synthetase [Candidatus Tokpelaia sp. JSC161]
MSKKSKIVDYSKTLYLPKTAFPMRASLPERERELLNYWEKIEIYTLLRKEAESRPLYVVHDGPPYANGNIHIGHALNKILKDIISRSFQMRGYNANYVLGWDCHGLPIEWKIEEKYRSSGLSKDSVPVNEFRRECREFASHWIDIQKQEFRRLGIIGDFKTPYLTMAFHAEAKIAEEVLKFTMSGQIYRGSKPVMWSIVEKTALAEAEIEYHSHESDSIFVKFPIYKSKASDLRNSCVVIWTTTPWTIPANRAVSFSSRISYGLYTIVSEPENHSESEKVILADRLANQCAKKAKIVLRRLRALSTQELSTIELSHPLKGLAGAYLFSVPLLESDHVKDDSGTGFVHIAPGHGQEDFELWISSAQLLKERGMNRDIPFSVNDAGFYTSDVPGFGPDRKNGAARVLDDNGNIGDANKAVISALMDVNRIFARGILKHSYPHSWRSKKPLIIRNTPQWFIHMDKDLGDGTTLRSRALQAITHTRFVPESGKIRLHSMIQKRPDWVLSRQRTWGVPIPIFFNQKGEILRDKSVNQRILTAFEKEGADSWFFSNARARFLGTRVNEPWEMVYDVLDVWFDSGTTHAFTLEDRKDLQWPADIYLEGSDQHRGWFHHSLLESCGTRKKAPYHTVITHGFTLDEKSRKMSKSLGNVVTPQNIIKQYGADLLRLWVVSSDYQEDQKIGQKTLQTHVDSYRKLRNIIRWMLGTLSHDQGQNIQYNNLPNIEKFMLHRLSELDHLVRKEYDNFNFRRIIRALLDFSIIDLSAFYFDIRKDALYCDSASSKRRLSALQTVREIFVRFITWLAPLLPFTTEEAWLAYQTSGDSIHLKQFYSTPQTWNDKILAEHWHKIRLVRRVVTGAIELERVHKRIGSSLEASPIIFIHDPTLFRAVSNVDMAEICITSDITVTNSQPTEKTFSIDEIPNVSVQVKQAVGRKCTRSWRYTKDVGMDPTFPDVSERDATALHELDSLGLLKLNDE